MQPLYNYSYNPLKNNHQDMSHFISTNINIGLSSSKVEAKISDNSHPQGL